MEVLIFNLQFSSKNPIEIWYYGLILGPYVLIGLQQRLIYVEINSNFVIVDRKVH
jgi:hypothetical protein